VVRNMLVGIALEGCLIVICVELITT
jgi:hypothetical protein